MRLLACAALVVGAVSGGARASGAQLSVPAPAGRGGGPGSRAGLERLSAVVQQRLQLTDEQTARLRETSLRYGEQRMALLRDEREARHIVRAEIARGDNADQSRVQGALDRLYASQQRRSALAAAEQRELAVFLTPTQRAQYAGMQERAFRMAQQIRQRREAAALAGDASEATGAAPGAAERRASRRAARAAEQAVRGGSGAGMPRTP